MREITDKSRWMRPTAQRVVPAILRWLTVVVVFSIIGCSRQGNDGGKKLERFVAASLPWPGATPLYVGIEKGYFRDEGLDLRLQQVPTGKAGLDAVLAGEADCAGAADTPVARAVIDGKPISVIATIADIQEAIMIIAKKESGISKADDLIGKTIGVTFGAGAQFFLHIYLVAYQINPDRVRIVNIPPDRTVEALLNGEVQAICTWSPYKLILREKLGSAAVILSDPALYLQTFNIVATQDYVKKNPVRIRKFLRALVRANAFIQHNPHLTRMIMSKYLGTAGSLYQTEWKDYIFTAVLDQGLLLNLEDQGRWMLNQEKNATKKMPNFLEFIDVSPLKSVQPDAVRIIGE